MKFARFLSLLLIAALAFASIGLVVAQDDEGEGVTITLAGWSSSPAEDEALQAAIDDFMAETGINVEWQINTDHNVQMQTAFASGDYPEVFYIDSSKLPEWATAGVVAVGEDNIEDQEGFFPALLDIFTFEGTLYCPPKDFSTMALQYNKDLFDAAGLDYPTADWTWDDLRAAAEALTDEEAGIVGLVTPPELPRFLPFLYQAGGAIFDEEGNYVFDSDETRQALEYYISFALDGIGGAPSVVDAGWGGEAFGTGRAAMAMEGNWVIKYLLDNFPDLNWGVTELPQGPAGRATMAFTVCYGVAADNDHPEESWALVNYLTGEEGARRVAEASFGPMPARTAAAEVYLDSWAERAAGTGLDPADLEAFVTGADYGKPWVLPPGWSAWADAFNATLQRAFAGEATVDDIIFETSLVA
ncbi:MAG: sugar ABC transporter substrate-binding protein, partial [Chloroflexi bacterium]